MCDKVRIGRNQEIKPSEDAKTHLDCWNWSCAKGEALHIVPWLFFGSELTFKECQHVGWAALEGSSGPYTAIQICHPWTRTWSTSRPYLMPSVAPCSFWAGAGMEAIAIAERNNLIRVNMFRIACSSFALASWEFNSWTATSVFVFMARLHFVPKLLMLRDLSHPAASNFSKNFWCPLIAGSQPRSVLWGKSIDCRTCSAVARFTNSPLASMPFKM